MAARTPFRAGRCARLATSLLWLASLSADAFSVPRSLGSPSLSSAARPDDPHDRDDADSSRRHAAVPASGARSGWTPPRMPEPAARRLGAALLATSLSLPVFLLATAAAPVPARAESARVVGRLQGSGLVFKDTLQIESFDDPKVQGVTLYVSNFERPITERLTSNFLQDPSYASVACVRTGPIKIADNIATGTGGEEVFEESRSLLFKTLRVQRIYDADKKAVVYVSFNTRLDKSDDTNKSRFKSSLCAVSLE